MKILMVSIFSSHFFNWTQQLENSGHEIWWLDVFDSNTKVEKINFVKQITGWRYRKDFRGRYYLKNNFPKLTGLINRINERDFLKTFEKVLQEFKPDVVHSFVMYLSSTPILPVMKRYPNIRWVYSSWGSDLFYYSKFNEYKEDIVKTLPRIDYLFTDCDRDVEIAQNLGFKGKCLGVFPGGGGYDINHWKEYIKRDEKRDIILVKGYEGLHGRASVVLKALKETASLLGKYRIIVFGAPDDLFKMIHFREIEILGNFEVRGKIAHSEVMKLMGASKIYIGNSLSDGIPNTCLEAIIMGAFPIQSNPGGASSEIIEHGENGYLIEEPENVQAIRELIIKALNNMKLIENAGEINRTQVIPKLDRDFIASEVKSKYQLIEEEIKGEKR